MNELKGVVSIYQHLKSALRLADDGWSLMLSCGHAVIVPPPGDGQAVTAIRVGKGYPDHYCQECTQLACRLLAQQSPPILVEPSVG